MREDWERDIGSIEPSVHVPLRRLETSGASDIAPLDPAVPTVVYCSAGIRSLRGIRILRERHGFRSAVSLKRRHERVVSPREPALMRTPFRGSIP